MGHSPLFDIAVVTCDRLALTKRCLDALGGLARDAFTLTVVDNASRDGTQDFLRQAQKDNRIDALYLLDRNMGVACAYNLAWNTSKAPLYMKLDNDIEFTNRRFIEDVQETFGEALHASLIGPMLAPAPEHFAPVRLQSGKTAYSALSSLSGAATLIPAALHERLGFWCEDYGLYGYEDADYMHRARKAGFATLAYPAQGALLHLGQASANPDDYPDNYPDNYSQDKSRIMQATLVRNKLFNVNCYLYNVGLREVYVKPRYVPQRLDEHRFAFSLDPEDRKTRAFLSACKRRIFDELDPARRESAVYAQDFIQSLAELKQTIFARD